MYDAFAKHVMSERNISCVQSYNCTIFLKSINELFPVVVFLFWIVWSIEFGSFYRFDLGTLGNGGDEGKEPSFWNGPWWVWDVLYSLIRCACICLYRWTLNKEMEKEKEEEEKKKKMTMKRNKNMMKKEMMIMMMMMTMIIRMMMNSAICVYLEQLFLQ